MCQSAVCKSFILFLRKDYILLPLYVEKLFLAILNYERIFNSYLSFGIERNKKVSAKVLVLTFLVHMWFSSVLNNHGFVQNSGNEFHKPDPCALPDFTNCLLRS